MSNEAINWAYRQDGLSCGAKFVLVALADFADHEWSCFPSQERLASMTGQSVRTVHTHLKTLTELGYVTREPRRGASGQRASDRYYLQPANLSGRVPNRQNTVEPTGNIGANQPAILAEEPLENPQENPSAPPGADTLMALDPTQPAKKGTTNPQLDAEFEANFWTRYPRRIAKADARKAYRAARKIASLTAIMSALERLIRSHPDEQFTPYPATWLRREPWADEPALEVPHLQEPAPMPDVDPDDVTAWVAAMEARRG